MGAELQYYPPDKGYISRQQQIILFESANIQPEVPLWSNQQQGKHLIRIKDNEESEEENRNDFFLSYVTSL